MQWKGIERSSSFHRANRLRVGFVAIQRGAFSKHHLIHGGTPPLITIIFYLTLSLRAPDMVRPTLSYGQDSFRDQNLMIRLNEQNFWV